MSARVSLGRKMFRLRMALRRLAFFRFARNIAPPMVVLILILILLPYLIPLIGYRSLEIILEYSALKGYEKPNIASVLANSYSTILVGLFALVGVVSRLGITQQETISERTLKFFHDNESSEFFQKQRSILEAHFPAGKVVSLEKYREYANSKDEKKQGAVEAITIILNSHEFLASGVRNGHYDKDIARDNVESILCSLVYDMQNIIANDIANDNSKKIFENLVALYFEWADRDAIGVEWDDEVEAKLTVSA